MKVLNIGIIGLDTSHAVAFTELLHNENLPYYIPNARITCAFPSGSPKTISQSRINEFTETVRSYGVEIVNTAEEVVNNCDAILLLSVDGGQHLAQFSEIAQYGKPVFIDKPLALSTNEAQQIYKLAKLYNTPIMTCSALRFAEDVMHIPRQDILAVDCYGPMPMLEQWNYFWYGIHTVEILFSLLGPGFKQVEKIPCTTGDFFIATWQDGRTATIRGHRNANQRFGATIHYAEDSLAIQVQNKSKPFYASLLEEIIRFFTTGVSPISEQETMEIILFLESMND
ncbi:Gfo/Idh/MocA family oxidoreductase [Solibacillus sp. CAU 1738]|uniref:Gfo/Idh/MocA family protein n=1 Tax=Solibacillus sp. CAU 1738 TaxID=3140363 RepID=UPI003260416B